MKGVSPMHQIEPNYWKHYELDEPSDYCIDLEYEFWLAEAIFEEVTPMIKMNTKEVRCFSRVGGKIPIETARSVTNGAIMEVLATHPTARVFFQNDMYNTVVYEEFNDNDAVGESMYKAMRNYLDQKAPPGYSIFVTPIERPNHLNAVGIGLRIEPYSTI